MQVIGCNIKRKPVVKPAKLSWSHIKNNQGIYRTYSGATGARLITICGSHGDKVTLCKIGSCVEIADDSWRSDYFELVVGAELIFDIQE